jgi:hypothetical protein
MDTDRFAALTRSRAPPPSRLTVLHCRRCGGISLTRRRLPVYLRPLRLLRGVGIDLRRYRCHICHRNWILRWSSAVPEVPKHP